MATSQQRRFRDAVTDMLDSWLWELADEISADPAVPPEIYQSPIVRTLEAVASDYACLCNDIFSYQKEMEFEGEVHNAVLAVRHFFRCGTTAAIEMVNDLMTARMRQFERILADELPALCEQQLDEQARG